MVEVVGAEEAGVMVMVEVLLDGNRNRNVIVDLGVYFNFFPTLKPPNKTLAFHQISVLIITFLAYASFHASRKAPSIVKSVLEPKLQSNSSSFDTGWAPFNGLQGTHRLGELDLAFLSAYSIGMYFAGHVGDRIDLRLFLAYGMLGSGVLTCLFGLGYWCNVHMLRYFVGVQVVCGLFQSIGWPCVVAVVGNWFGKTKRGCAVHIPRLGTLLDRLLLLGFCATLFLIRIARTEIKEKLSGKRWFWYSIDTQ